MCYVLFSKSVTKDGSTNNETKKYWQDLLRKSVISRLSCLIAVMGQEQDYEMETQNDILTKAKADYPKRAQSTPYNISVKYQQLMFQLSKNNKFLTFCYNSYPQFLSNIFIGYFTKNILLSSNRLICTTTLLYKWEPILVCVNGIMQRAHPNILEIFCREERDA